MSDWSAEVYCERLKPCPSCGKPMIRAGYLMLEGQRSWQYLPTDCHCFTSFSESETKSEALKLDHITCMDNMEYLKSLPDNYVDCVCTSPSYFNLRDYGTATWEGGDRKCKHSVGNQVQDNKNPGAITSGVRPGVDASKCRKCGAIRLDKQIGLESTPQEYVKRLVAVFREVKRVLKPSGNFFLNLGDSYSTHAAGKVSDPLRASTLAGTRTAEVARAVASNKQEYRNSALAEKNLIGIPWLVAFALQQDGWILRGDAPWIKKNVMPESIRDRWTKAHEYVFHFVKSPRYWFDVDAIRQPASDVSLARIAQPNFANQKGGEKDYGKTGINRNRSARKALEGFAENPGRNYRSSDAWFAGLDEQIQDMARELAELINLRDNGGVLVGDDTIDTFALTTEPNYFAHFAAFSTKLVEPCVLAGCPDKICTQCGKPWTRIIEKPDMAARPTLRDSAKTSDGTVNIHQGWGDRPRSAGGAYQKWRNANPDKTLGWQPTCKCNADHRPGIVLDPFMGSGTVALVARANGRHYIGCDLNQNYVDISKERLRQPFEAHHIQKETDLHDLPLFQGVGD